MTLKKDWWDRPERGGQYQPLRHSQSYGELNSQLAGRVPYVYDDFSYISADERAFDKAVKSVNPPWRLQWENHSYGRDALMANCERLARSKKPRHMSQCYSRVWARYLLEKLSA